MKIKENGFTLVELLIALGVGLIIMAAVYEAMNVAQRSSVGVGRKVATQQDARAVLDIMAMEVRMASLNPSASRTIWGTMKSCATMGNVVPVIANKGIQVAEPDRILIAMDLNNPSVYPATIGDSVNEYIEYEYKNDKKTITRNVSCDVDSSILGGTGSETMVRNGDTGIPLFQYFDKNNTLLPAPVNITEIRRIRITIVADTENRDMLSRSTKRMTYTTDVLVKNHVLCP